MRSYPDENDKEDLERLNVQPWMVELLKLNPEYVHWGPGEDYMRYWERTKYNRDRWSEHAWDNGVYKETWKAFREEGWDLDELNELVHFYFQLNRKMENCEACDETGYNPETRHIADTFYSHARSDRPVPGAMRMPDFLGGGYLIGDHHEAWHDKITQDEVDALIEADRLWDFTRTCEPGEGWKEKDPPYRPTAEEVNKWESERKAGGHDGLNRCILIRTRAERLGVYGHCEKCDGQGFTFQEPEGHVGLVLWMLHPRKGCSRGIHINHIDKEDLPAVFKYLKDAADRNAERFAKVVAKI
jgi:hypothetical protein